jgi:uncharacterized iron-regulated protein
MKKNLLLIVLIVTGWMDAFAQKEAFVLLNEEGKVISYEQMLKELQKADVVFLGEYHDQPITHWLQLNLLKDLHSATDKKIRVGAEMFETDDQLKINEYFQGIISQKKFEEESRLWKNYSTDYKGIVEFCKENKLPFLATNVPGRYANAVYSKGPAILESLSEEAKRLLPPYPIHFNMDVNCYQKMIKDMGGHGGSNIAYAQALRDATMAHTISQNMEKGTLFLHLNGSYHSDYHEGIVYYLKRDKPKAKIVVLTTIYEENIRTLSEENKGKADFFISIDSGFTRSY